jgi:hypothetical protein
MGGPTVPFAFAFAALLGAGCPKPPPPKLPPREVASVNRLNNTTGERDDVVADAVQSGSNLARVLYDCGPPHSRGSEGKAVLSAEVSKCEFDRAQQTLTLTSQSTAECQTFLVTISPYKGPGTYNTSSLGKLSFGTARMRHAACGWDGNQCLEWNGQTGPHPEASCTIEVNSDGGLQYGTASSTVSGTFVCDGFASPYKGCAGAPAKTSCIISRASFSVAGCTVVGKAPKKPDKKKAKAAAAAAEE